MGLGIQSHHEQKSQTPVRSGSPNFHQVVSILVPKVVGLMCRDRSAFDVFDNSDQDLTQFIEIMVFHRCHQFLVPWPRGVEPELAWPGIRRTWSFRVVGYWVPLDTQIFLRSRQAKCSLVAQCMADYSRLWSYAIWGFERWSSHVSLLVYFGLSVWALRCYSHLAQPCDVFHSWGQDVVCITIKQMQQKVYFIVWNIYEYIMQPPDWNAGLLGQCSRQ
jgi:hypothetical protein